ncbi:MAG: gliding motility-associated C-terminal domain-containing protein [Bacteroidales bacterium]
MTRVFLLVSLFLLISIGVVGQCVNPPTVVLSSTSGSTCGTTGVTVSGNTFGGSATKVTITENGSGSVTPTTATISPFAFTYTPKSNDIGKNVIITVTTNVVSGSHCSAAKATYTLTVNAIPSAPVVGAITQPTCSAPTGSVVLSGLPGTGTWTLIRSPGGVITTGTGTSITITGLAAGTYTYTVTNATGCISVASANVVINASSSAPAAPVVGTITRPTCIVSTGSVLMTGLPSTGTWTLIRTPGGVTTTGSGTSITISNLSEGTYTYTVTNSAGCISPSSGNVVIPAQPATPSSPTVGTITPPTCTLSTGSVILNGLPSTGTWTLTRYPGTVTSSGTGTSTTISGLSSGTYNFTVADAAGCLSAPSANILIPAQPANPTAPTVGTIIQPTCTLSTGTVVLSGLPASDTWTLIRYPDGILTTGSVTSITISGLTPGTYTYKVINSAGCTSGTSSDIVISAWPDTPTVIITNPAALCSPLKADLTAAAVTNGSTPGLTFTYWTDATATVAYTTPSAADSGTYYIKGTTSSGCSDTKPVTVTINPLPTANAGTGGDKCDLTFKLNAVASIGTGTWMKTAGPGTATFAPNANTATATVTVSENGTYAFMWTEINGTCSASDYIWVTFHDMPVLNAGIDTVICRGSNIQLHAHGTGSFLWAPSDLINNPNIADPVATPFTTTTFRVTLTDLFGCKDSDNVRVEVRKNSVANAGTDQVLDYLFETNMEAVPATDNETGLWTVISGTGKFFDSTYAKTSVSGLSIDENKFLWTITNGVCPPSSDTVMITVHDMVIPTLITPNMDGRNDYFIVRRINTPDKIELVIFDRRGAQVYKNKNYDNSWNGVDYNAHPLPDDTYFYVLKTENGKSLSGYIVIRR